MSLGFLNNFIFSTWWCALDDVHGLWLLFWDGHQGDAQTLDVISAVLQVYDGVVAAREDVAVNMDGTHLPEYHSHLLRQKCFVDHVFDEEQFSGLRGHRIFWTTGTISLSTKLNAPPLQNALLLGWVWQSSVSRQDVATHQVLSGRGYKRRLLAVELEALLDYRRGATAGLLAWATTDSDQARITGFVASLESIEENASPSCSRLFMLGCCEKLCKCRVLPTRFSRRWIRPQECLWTLCGRRAHISSCCMRSVLLVLTSATNFNVETCCMLLWALIKQNGTTIATLVIL